MTRPTTAGISPFFIVSDVEKSVAYYRETLGFEATLQEPAQRPFFAIIRRDGAQVFLKADKGATPRPNPQCHPSMRWNAFVYTPDPDGLAADCAESGAICKTPLQDTHDGLRGFELADPDGYVLFFGRPRE